MPELEPIWNRRVGETDKAYAAFCAYLALPPSKRSIDRAYAAQRQKDGETASENSSAPRHWDTWSAENNWVDRVAAYDAHVELQARAAREAEHAKQLAEYRAGALRRSRRLAKLADKFIDILDRKIQGLTAADIDPDKLGQNLKAAVSAVDVAMSIEAEALATRELEYLLDTQDENDHV